MCSGTEAKERLTLKVAPRRLPTGSNSIVYIPEYLVDSGFR